MTSLYCPVCGARVEDSKVGMDVVDGKVTVSTPMLFPCEHNVKPVTLEPSEHTFSDLPAIVNEGRHVVIKSRSTNVNVDATVLRALVQEVQGMLDTADNAKQAVPEPKPIDPEAGLKS